MAAPCAWRAREPGFFERSPPRSRARARRPGQAASRHSCACLSLSAVLSGRRRPPVRDRERAARPLGRACPGACRCTSCAQAPGAAARHARGAVVGLAGGPGAVRAAALRGLLRDDLGPALRTRDLVVFDQRGTGLSGLCGAEPRSSADRAANPRGDPGLRGASSGPARAFYTSRDSADDIEAVRGRPKESTRSLYGTSYGTKVALAYAQRYPAHVERLVLDSLVDLDGPDPFYRDTFAAIPRVLSDLCGPTACDRDHDGSGRRPRGAREAARDAVGCAASSSGATESDASRQPRAHVDLRHPARGRLRPAVARGPPGRRALRARGRRRADVAPREDRTGRTTTSRRTSLGLQPRAL